MLSRHRPEETSVCISAVWMACYAVFKEVCRVFDLLEPLYTDFISDCLAQISLMSPVLDRDDTSQDKEWRGWRVGGWVGEGFQSKGKISGDVHTHPTASIHIHTNTPVTQSPLSLSFSPSFSAERLSVTLIRNGQSHIKHGGDEKGRDGR